MISLQSIFSSAMYSFLNFSQTIGSLYIFVSLQMCELPSVHICCDLGMDFGINSDDCRSTEDELYVAYYSPFECWGPNLSCLVSCYNKVQCMRF